MRGSLGISEFWCACVSAAIASFLLTFSNPQKKKKKEMERINAELHQKIFTMEQELKELRVFKAEVTSAVSV